MTHATKRRGRPPANWSPEEDAIIIEARGRGVHIRDLYKFLPQRTKYAAARRASILCKTRTRVSEVWSPVEIEQMRAMWATGASARTIGRALGKTPAQVLTARKAHKLPPRAHGPPKRQRGDEVRIIAALRKNSPLTKAHLRGVVRDPALLYWFLRKMRRDGVIEVAGKAHGARNLYRLMNDNQPMK